MGGQIFQCHSPPLRIHTGSLSLRLPTPSRSSRPCVSGCLYLRQSPGNDATCQEQFKIRVENLRRRAENGDVILENVSFRVRRGEVHGLIGPSGSGKSTVLRALNRLWEPPESSVFLDGLDVTKLDVIKLRRKVGMVFQQPFLFDGECFLPSLFAINGRRWIIFHGIFTGNVADNVKYGPSLQGKKLCNEELLDLLSKSGFADIESSFLTKWVKELSGGEAQRVSLARTLANKPEVLLLDEPTSSLDPVSTRIVENTIWNLKEKHELTVILVSHNLEQIDRLADVVSVLVQGSLLKTGSLDELKNSSGVLTQFFTTAGT